MAAYNYQSIIGNVGRDAEVRYSQGGFAFGNFSVAVTEKWKDKNTQEEKSHTEWFEVKVSGRQAEIAAQYIKKGRQVFVQGKQRTEKWNDKDTGAPRSKTTLKAYTFQLLGKRDDQSEPTKEERLKDAQEEYGISDEELGPPLDLTDDPTGAG